jgi:hypothetical protein
VVALMAVVVRTVLRPDTDPVRLVGADDPEWPGAAERAVVQPVARPETVQALQTLRWLRGTT